MKYKYKHAAVGGTFDLLHKGHEALLLNSFKAGEKVTIGVTSDRMNKLRSEIIIQNQTQRVKKIKEFLKQNKLTKRSKVIIISNIYGPTLKDKTIDTLIVSKETTGGAKIINKARTAKKLKKLPVILTKMVLAQDKKPISSTKIRSGKISRSGKSYQKQLLRIVEKRFNQNTRNKLKKPFGKIVKKPQKNTKGPIIAVGDETTSKLLKANILPKISIIDFHIQRKVVFYNLNQLGFTHANPDVVAKNTPGKISKQLALEVEKAIDKDFIGQVILISGEDDLAVIPAVLISPLGAVVYYGQPDKGLVKVDVNEKSKEALLSLLSLK